MQEKKILLQSGLIGFSLSVQCFLDRMLQLRQDLIRGTFQTKALGLVPRYPLQRPLSKGVEGSGGEREGRTKV